MYLCMYVCMYVCVYVCLSVCLYVCMNVCMYVCICVWLYRLSMIIYRASLRSQLYILSFCHQPHPHPKLRTPGISFTSSFLGGICLLQWLVPGSWVGCFKWSLAEICTKQTVPPSAWDKKKRSWQQTGETILVSPFVSPTSLVRKCASSLSAPSQTATGLIDETPIKQSIYYNCI